MVEDNQAAEKQRIKLSRYTSALIASINSIKPKPPPDEFSKLTVSQTVSFFALAYEKIRNAVEYREDHQIRRAAIERILKRKLTINPTGKGEAENLLRELLWARYFENESLGTEDIKKIQEIIDKFLYLRNLVVAGRDYKTQEYLNEFIIQLLTAEIEETLAPQEKSKNATYTYFIYQVLRRKIKIEGLTESQKDAYFLAALEKSFRRSDKSYQHYHLFITFYQPIRNYSYQELDTLSSKIPDIFKKIDEMTNNPYVDNLVRFIKKQLPPFLILFSLFKQRFGQVQSILTNKTRLWQEVDISCRDKYQQIGKRLRNLAIRSFIYIFLTKMLFALILEYPVSIAIYGDVNRNSIIINSLFPPILMLMIISVFRLPGEDNTKRIYDRIIEITNADMSFETKVAYMPKKQKIKKPVLIFGFTVFYSLTFIITLSLIYEILTYLNFNLVSQIIFIFFVSLVTFFSYRIKQIVNEYQLKEKEGILAPIGDFFFMPILFLGKFFSSELARLNFFIFIFDFLIEAPFKLVFEVLEEWISFVRKRKEEIV